MTKKYLEEFREVCQDVSGHKTMGFAMRLSEESELTLLNDVDLDVEEDYPVPDWVIRIILTPNLSKRVKINLICFHNEQIRTYRMRKAKGL